MSTRSRSWASSATHNYLLQLIAFIVWKHGVGGLKSNLGAFRDVDTGYRVATFILCLSLYVQCTPAFGGSVYIHVSIVCEGLPFCISQFH